MATAALPGWMLTFLFLAGAPVSLPLSLPPLQEDPLLAKVAPEQCLWYVSLAGVDKADPASKNKVEQLLAEDDVQHFIHELGAQLQASFAAAAPQNPLGKALAEEGPKLLGTLLTRPMVAYVASVAAGPKGPMIRAGLVVNLGDHVADTQASLEKIDLLIPRHESPQSSGNPSGTTDSGRHDSTPTSPAASVPDSTGWHTLPTSPDAPQIQWGFKDKYLIIAIGEGEADLLWGRTSKPVPAWLTELRSQLKVERPAMVQYINVQTLAEMAQTALAANQGAENTRALFEALGIQKVKYLASVGGLEGQGYTSRALLAIDGQPTGLLALVGGQPLDAAALDLIPADASFALAARADVTKIIDAVLSVATVLEPQARQEFDGGMQQLSQITSVNIKDDLLGSLGDAWCVYNSPGDGGLVFTGLTLTATIRDRTKLLQAHDKLIAFAKMAEQMRRVSGQASTGPSLAETEFHGQKIMFLNFVGGDAFPFAPAWCITDKQVVFALFPQTIKSYLQRQSVNSQSGSLSNTGPADADQGKHKLTDVPEVAQMFSGGSGPAIFSYQDTPNQFKFFYPLLQIFTQLACSQMQQQGVKVNIGILPNSRAILPHLTPSVAMLQSTQDGIRFESHGTLPSGVGNLPMLAVPMLLPATMKAREAAEGAASMNNMKQIALAMLNFEDAHKSFPPAFKSSKEGKPLLSWRVLILPQLEEAELFKQFKLDEPWDSENNKKLIERMPQVYKAPGSKVAGEFKTVYLTVRGENTVFPGDKGIKLAQITDGTSKTIMVVEAPDDKAVVWTKPDDFEFDQDDSVAALPGLRARGFLAAFCDGHVELIPQSAGINAFKALSTRNGGEVIQLP
ncbi:MAG TPA: DUF1559 domain-containing protein [Pirellulales bacterium]|nr:DUF1559 domain-containing protein [Pirellulales bacterium]